jgi:hypothetical protein
MPELDARRESVGCAYSATEITADATVNCLFNEWSQVEELDCLTVHPLFDPTFFSISSITAPTDPALYPLRFSTERPMKIEIVFDPAKQPLVNRVAAPKAAAAPSTVAAAGGAGAPAR